MASVKINKILVGIFGSRNERLVKAYMEVARQAGAIEDGIRQLSDEALKAKTEECKGAVTSKIHLVDKHIEFCTNCRKCTQEKDTAKNRAE